MSQLQSNVEKTPQRQNEVCMTKYNEIQMDKKLRQHKLRTENKKQNDTEVIHREVRGGTKTKCYLKENQSEFSETRRRKDLVKKHSEFDSVTLTAPAKTMFADEAHVPGACPRANRRTDHRGASAAADFGQDRRRDETGPT